MKNQNFLKRLGFASSGLKTALKSESSFKIHTCAAIAVMIFLGAARATPLWWAIIMLTLGAVLTAEMFNTSLEALIDHLHPERHASIGIAKDCAAGAVLVASLISLGVFVSFVIDRWY